MIGGGYVGLELGQMFAQLGVHVTMLVRHARILRHEDPAIGNALAGYLKEEGIDIRINTSVKRIGRNGDYRIHVNQNGKPQDVVADQLLVATGRRANTRGFGLEEAGVRLGDRGEIVVDEYLRTSVPRIYAAGDVTGEPMYVYVAARAGALAAENALNGNPHPIDLTAVPKVTFTDPAVASVGLTEYEATSRGISTLTSELPLTHVARALAARVASSSSWRTRRRGSCWGRRFWLRKPAS